MDKSRSNNSLTFEYFQYEFLVECLLKIAPTDADEKEFLDFVLSQFAADPAELELVVEFKRSYSADRALQWYLRESFLYKILNNSLEIGEIRNLYLFRRILRDLNNEMERRRSTTPIHVYRSQLMSKDLLHQWTNLIGQCLVIRSFLSATLNVKIAEKFLKSHRQIDDQYERVLIEIDADPRVNASRPFVQMNSLNFAEDQNEVLFSFGSIFLLNDVRCGNDGIYRIELTLYTDVDHEFKTMFNDLRTTYSSSTLDLLDFAQILTNFDRLNDAEHYLKEQMKKMPKDHPDTSRAYRIYGSIALAENHFDSSLNWFRKALEFDLENSTDKTPMKLAEIHELIGQVYSRKGSIDDALSHYSAALEIRQSSLSSEDETIGRTYEQLALLYHAKGDLSGARTCLERARRIYQRTSTKKLVEIDEQLQRFSSR